MTDQPTGRIIRVVTTEQRERPVSIPRPENHAQAAKTLGETSYLAWSLVQSCKLFIKLVERRWPESS